MDLFESADDGRKVQVEITNKNRMTQPTLIAIAECCHQVDL